MGYCRGGRYRREDKVSSLILSSGHWNEDLLRSIFHADQLHDILSIKPLDSGAEDVISWSLSPSGLFSVRSGYDGLKDEAEATRSSTTRGRILKGNKRIPWRLNIRNSLKIFVWRSINDALPIGRELLKRNVGTATGCPFCNQLETDVPTESLEHLFRDCPFSRRIWVASPLGLRMDAVEGNAFGEWCINWLKYLHKLDNNDHSNRISQFVAVMWAIWRERNEVIFRQQQFSVARVSNIINYNASIFTGRTPTEKAIMVEKNSEDLPVLKEVQITGNENCSNLVDLIFAGNLIKHGWSTMGWWLSQNGEVLHQGSIKDRMSSNLQLYLI